MKIRKNIIYILFVALIITSLMACKPASQVDIDKVQEENKEAEDEFGIKNTEEYVEFADGRGETIQIKKNPNRVIVLFSSFIDIWVRNGGELVGMVEDDTIDIKGLENVEVIGKYNTVSLEKVIELKPDLVILSSNSKAQKELIDPLLENNIPIIPLTYEYKDDYFKIAKIFALINDRADIYDNETVKIKDEIKNIIDSVPKENSPKILIMFASSKGITARTSSSTVGEILKDLNTINIADNSNNLLDDKNFSLEKIIEENPDFIFVQTMGSDMDAVNERIKTDAESNPAWSNLSAIKNNRYIILSKDLYMYKANRRYAEAYKNLAEIIYPEVFKK